MIIENKDSNSITIVTESSRLSCTYEADTLAELKKLFGIDIGKEIEQLLTDEECLGYLPGEYTFSFQNRHLSLHHKVLKEEIKNNLTRIMRRYCYEKNDEDTRLNVTADIKNYLDMIHEKGSLYDFNIICDNTNNTEDIIQQNRLNCRIGLKFKKDADFIIIDGMVSRLQEDSLDSTLTAGEKKNEEV